MTTPTMVPSGWFTDPSGRHEFRFWDGSTWTGAVSDAGITTTDALQQPPSPLPRTAPVPEPAPAAAPAPVPAAWTAAPDSGRRGRTGHRWVLLCLIAFALLALIVGLLAWSPWSGSAGPGPVRLGVDRVTTTSVIFHWSPPPTTTAPATYVVLRGGQDVATVPGTVRHYGDHGLAPATGYRYQVVAIVNGDRSTPSAVLAVRTTAPPVGSARLEGRWPVHMRITATGGGSLRRGERMTATWVFRPTCATGACTTLVTGAFGGNGYTSHSFKATLTRHGATYTGSTQAHVTHCSYVDVTNSVTVRIKVTRATTAHGVWTARVWVGDVTIDSPYTSVGLQYCPAQTVTANLAAGR